MFAVHVTNKILSKGTRSTRVMCKYVNYRELQVNLAIVMVSARLLMGIGVPRS